MKVEPEVNFYKHHLGDYDGHTAHLTWDEDMAYTRLLRAYYRREKGIPDSEKYRLARANSKAQKGAVDRVLDEFFTKHGNDWKQKRCDEEIESYQKQVTTNRRIAHERTDRRTVNEPSTNHIPNQNQIPEPDTSYPADFEKTWEIYPKRLGDNPKRKALKAWSARRGEGHGAEEIHAGVERYAIFCRSTNKEGTESVKHAATFFGPEKPFLLAWETARSVGGGFPL